MVAVELTRLREEELELELLLELGSESVELDVKSTD